MGEGVILEVVASRYQPLKQETAIKEGGGKYDGHQCQVARSPFGQVNGAPYPAQALNPICTEGNAVGGGLEVFSQK